MSNTPYIYPEIQVPRDPPVNAVFPATCPCCGAAMLIQDDGNQASYVCGGRYQPKDQIQNHTDKWWGQCPKTRADYLRGEIKRHRDLYYKQAETEVTDPEFDDLVHQLAALEAIQPELVTPDSPTQTVGDDHVDGFVKVRHDTPMLSLGNVYSFMELEAWHERVLRDLGGPVGDYLVSVKVDGAAMELVYEDGLLQRGLTRGDGTDGDDVTDNCRAIGNVEIPARLDGVTGRINVRGEIYFTDKDFELANTRRVEVDGKEPFANPRNAASGTLKLQDPIEVGRRGLSFFAHSLGHLGHFSEERYSTQDYFTMLRQLGFPVVQHKLCGTLMEVWHWIEKLDRAKLDFPCDGVVISVNARATQDRLGTTGHSPRWAVAYKYPAEQATTVITSIVVQVGRTGRATPVANLEPVKLAGTTVSRATLHNQDECDRKGVFAGASVVIEKGGEIIPKVVRVIGKATPTLRWVMPAECPECQSELHRIEGEANFFCTNAACPAKVLGWILHWASRDVMNIQGLGVEIADLLVRKLGVENPCGLYALSYSGLTEVAGIGPAVSRKLMVELAKSYNRPFSCTLDGLGIQGIGTTMSRELVKHFADIHDLCSAADEQLLAVPGFGKKTLADFRAWLKDDDQQKHLEHLIMANLRMKRTLEETPVQADESAASHPFFGKTMVFTGTLSMDRSAAEALATGKGAKTSGSISKKTHILVAGPGAGGKLAKAEGLGVEVIDEEEFLRRLSA